MKPIDFNGINKVSGDTGISVKNKHKIKNGRSFEDILGEELDSLKNQKTSKSGNIMQTSQLLNIKPLSNENIFAEKGLNLCSEINNLLENMSSCLKDNGNVKDLISKLNSYVQDLSKVSDHIEDEGIKDIINRTTFLSNIEIEKYIRGDYS